MCHQFLDARYHAFNCKKAALAVFAFLEKARKIIDVGIHLGISLSTLGIIVLYSFGIISFFSPIKACFRGSYFFCAKELVGCPTRFLDPRFLGSAPLCL